jgi:ATP-binding cassette, subfamily B, bacterial
MSDTNITDPRTVQRGLAIIWMAIRIAPRPFGLAVAGSVLFACATVGSALAVGWVTDTLIEPAFRDGAIATATLMTGPVVILGVAVANALGIATRRIAAYYMQYGLHAHFRRRVSRQFTRLPMSWHRNRSTGELISNANADVEASFWPIAPLPLTVGVLVMLVLSVGLLVATDVWMAAVGLLVIPLIMLVNLRYNAAVRGPATRAQERRADVAEVAHESFDGALVVKTLGKEDHEEARFAAQSERLRDEMIRFGRVRAVFDPVMEALPSVAILAVLLVGSVRLAAGAVSTGDIVLVGYLFVLLEFPLRALGFILVELPRSVVGWERVKRVLDARPEDTPGTRALADGAQAASVTVDDVDYRYARDAATPVLSSVAFALRPGATTALVGPTGSGKSTVASLLVRLAHPDEGAVALDGFDLRELHPGAVPGHAALVFQHTFLFDDTVRENITLGGAFSDEEVCAAARLAQADDFVRALPAGYDTVIGERGTTLSGGQRQRLALARALVRKPRLLILDDATSSVDPVVERAILRGLREADLPSTVLVVAHRRATIELADEVIFLDGGKVTGIGAHADLMERLPSYQRLITAYEQESA